jgi:hypothetical protein
LVVWYSTTVNVTNPPTSDETARANDVSRYRPGPQTGFVSGKKIAAPLQTAVDSRRVTSGFVSPRLMLLSIMGPMGKPVFDGDGVGGRDRVEEIEFVLVCERVNDSVGVEVAIETLNALCVWDRVGVWELVCVGNVQLVTCLTEFMPLSTVKGKGGRHR